jgi:hypothetical protein
MIRSQLTFVLVTVTGAEVLGEADGVTDAHGVDVTEVLGAGVVVALVTVELGEADVLGDADGLAVDVSVGVAAGSLGVIVTGADAIGADGPGR